VNSEYVIKKVKEWALMNYGVIENSVNVFSVKKLSNGYWNARCSFIINNEERRFSLSLDSNGDIVSYSDLQKAASADMGSAPTMILIAEVFSIIGVVAIFFGIIVITLISVTSVTAVSPNGVTTLNPMFAGFAIPLVFLLIMAIISLYILSRILRIRRYILAGDAASAYEEDSVGLGVLALIFNGVIAGILLLLAREDLRRASQ